MELNNKSLKFNLKNEKNKPLVTVFVWVYNDESYLKDCLESIIGQNTSFSVEIILHDDCSSDGTKSIIKHYENKYPFLFNNILQTENQWSQGKSVMLPLYTKPRGKYVALMHGDDYWIDINKLQKQFEFLEFNNDVVLCCANSKVLTDSVLHEDNKINTYLNDTFLNTNNILSDYIYNPIPTSTILLRKSVLEKINPNFIDLFKIGDWPLLFEFSRFGKIYLNSEFLSVYRISNKGAWSGSDNKLKLRNKMEFYFLIKINFPFYSDICDQQIIKVIEEYRDLIANDWCLFFDKKLEDQYRLLNSRTYKIKNSSFLDLIKLIIHKILSVR